MVGTFSGNSCAGCDLTAVVPRSVEGRFALMTYSSGPSFDGGGLPLQVFDRQ